MHLAATNNHKSDFITMSHIQKTINTNIQLQTQTEFYSTSIEIKSVTSGCKNNMVENKR